MLPAALHSRTGLWGPETWVAPLGLEEFSRTHWCKGVPLVVHGPGRRAARLREHVERSTGPSRIPPNAGATATVRLVEGGKLVTLTMPRDDAAKMLRMGKTVSVFEPECLRPLARDFARALSVPPDRLEFNAYLSSAGGFTTSHFDATESIILQIRGTKVWRLAKGEIEGPLKHAARGEEPPMALRLHVHGEWPREAPAGEVEVEARPGTVLYLPRGFWHSTATAADDSLSLHFHYGTEAMIDLLWPVLYRELVRDPAWREAAWGPGGRRSDASARARLTALLARAATSLSEMRGEDLLQEPPSPRASLRRVRRRAGIGLGIEGTARDDGRVVRVITPDPRGDRVVECAVAPELVDVALWIAAQPLSARLRAEDAPRAAGVSLEDVRELFGVLATAGAVAAA